MKNSFFCRHRSIAQLLLISTFTLYYVLMFLCFHASASENKNETVSITISSFNYLGTEDRRTLIKKAVRHLLSISLLPYRKLNIISIDDFAYASGSSEKFNSINELNSIKSIQSKDKALYDGISELNSQFVVTGVIFERNDGLIVRMRLLDLRDEKNTRSIGIGSFPINNLRLINKGEFLAKSIMQKLAEIGALSFNIRRFAISCFLTTDEQGDRATITASASEYLSIDPVRTVYDNLVKNSRSEAIEWLYISDDCIRNEADAEKKLKDDEIDAIFAGKIIEKENGFLFRTSLYVKNKNQVVQAPLPVHTQPKNQLDILISDVATDIDSLSYGIVDETGTWRLYGFDKLVNPTVSDVVGLAQIGESYTRNSGLQGNIDNPIGFRKQNANQELGYFFLNWAYLLSNEIDYEDIFRESGLAKLYVNLGRVYSGKGDIGKAGKMFRLALEVDPNFWKANFELGNLEYFSGELDSAILLYREAVKASPRDIQSRQRIAEIYSLQGKYLAAKDEYKDLARYLDAGDPTAAVGLAYVNVEAGNLTEAIANLEFAIKTVSKKVQEPVTMGLDSKQIINLKGMLANVHFQLARSYDGKDIPQAIEHYTVSIANRVDFETYRSRARAYAALGDYENAVSDLTQALKLDDFPKVVKGKMLINRALYYTNTKDYTNADKDLSEAEEIDAKNEYLYLVKGLSLMMQNQIEPAVYNFLKSAGMREENGYKASAIENIGIAYLHEKKWREALEITEQVNNFSSKNAWNWLVRAIAADKLNKDSISIESLARWYELKTDYDVLNLQIYLPQDLKSYVFRS